MFDRFLNPSFTKESDQVKLLNFFESPFVMCFAICIQAFEKTHTDSFFNFLKRGWVKLFKMTVINRVQKLLAKTSLILYQILHHILSANAIYSCPES